MAFTKQSTLSPYGAPVKRSAIITNSITVTEMDSVKITSGFVALGTTGALVFGHVLAIGSSKGVGLNTTGAAGAEMGSYINAFTTSSTNQTVANVKAECDISKFTVYSASANATLGTTTGSNLLGYTMDINDEKNLKENTALTTTGQYVTHGVDPVNTARALVNIYESQIMGV